MPLEMRTRDLETAAPLPASPTLNTAVTPTSLVQQSTPSSFREVELPLDSPKVPEIEPPIRPKSTPFPRQEPANSIQPAWRLIDDYTIPSSKDESHLAEQAPSLRTTFAILPIEIHECILDHVFGVRASTTSGITSSRGWSTALRHSRRRQLSDLALVNRRYRELVQGRIFKHIKVQGSRPSIDSALEFFYSNMHLRKHIRHIEVWSPVWERKGGNLADQVIIPPTTPERATLIRVINAPIDGAEASSNVTSAYQLASRNATLQEIFTFVHLAFPNACVLTLEGGHCKKPPMVKHFPDDADTKKLPILPQIRILILKSAWNIMRTEEDFDIIMDALPSLREWRSSYAKPKSKSYLNISKVAPKLPSTIRHLEISLESTYSREAMSPMFWRKIYPHQAHICVQLAKTLPQLESFTYYGRICHHFFQQLFHSADPDCREFMKLKSIDLTVKNCCRPMPILLDGTGITDIKFISALESLVIAGVRSLSRLPALKFLRIRYIDLESPMPLLNPFFQMKDNDCTGLWSEGILEALASARPMASYSDLSDDFSGISFDKDGKIIPGEIFPRRRPLSLKVSSYEALSNDMTIN